MVNWSFMWIDDCDARLAVEWMQCQLLVVWPSSSTLGEFLAHFTCACIIEQHR